MDASRACRTVKGATLSPLYTPGTSIRVAPGRYYENNPILMQPSTSILGSDLRTTFIEPLNKTQDLFHVQSGCYIAQLQMSNGRSGLLPIENSSGYNRGFRRPVLTRQTNAPTVNLWGSTPTVSPFDNLDTDDLSENELEISVDDMSHVVSNFEDSPYITPTATQVMREISTGTTCDIFAQSKNYISDDSDTDIDDM
jgi:hypothetical protein